MSAKDRVKWNRKYQEKPALLSARPPSPFVANYYHYAPHNSAIDIACGNGRHTLFLAQHGFSVDAVEISSVAIESLTKKITPAMKITPIEADLDNFEPSNMYGLAVMTNFLDREVIERIAKSLLPHGVFIVETYMAHPDNEKTQSNPDFLLQPKELQMLFKEGFECLAYEEFWNEPHELYRMRKQAIVVRKH